MLGFYWVLLTKLVVLFCCYCPCKAVVFLKEPFSFCLPASASVSKFFYSSSRRMTSNFHISSPKLQFLPTPPVCAPCFFLVSPPRFYPSCALRRWRWLVFRGASLSIPMTALLFGVNEKETNKQKNDNKTSERRGAENQLSWTSRPAPGEGKHCVLTELPNYFGGKTRRTGTHMLQFRGY